MPFKSQAQRKYLHANHPDIAAQYEAETSPLAALPDRVRKTKTRAVSKATQHTRKALKRARVR